MSDDRTVFDRIRSRSEEVLNQVVAQLMSNPQFVKAMQGAMRGKETLDRAVAQGLKNMNIPTRTEFKRALARIEALETDLAETKEKLAAASSGARRAGSARSPRSRMKTRPSRRRKAGSGS
jgi:hypothetical protein